MNIYHEARGEPEPGKYAVAAVTLNRVKSKKHPNRWYRLEIAIGLLVNAIYQ